MLKYVLTQRPQGYLLSQYMLCSDRILHQLINISCFLRALKTLRYAHLFKSSIWRISPLISARDFHPYLATMKAVTRISFNFRMIWILRQFHLFPIFVVALSYYYQDSLGLMRNGDLHMQAEVQIQIPPSPLPLQQPVRNMCSLCSAC